MISENSLGGLTLKSCLGQLEKFNTYQAELNLLLITDAVLTMKIAMQYVSFVKRQPEQSVPCVKS